MLYMSKAVDVNFKLNIDEKKSMKQACSESSVDPFYSESNIRYLENIVHDINKGKAHFAEHELIKVD